MSNEINNDPNWESRCNKDDLVLNGPSKIKRVYDIILFVPGSLFSCWENMVRLVVGRTLFFVSH